VLDPPEVFLTVDEFFGRVKNFSRMDAAAEETGRLPPLMVERKHDNPLHRLSEFIAGFPGRVLVAAESLGRRETMGQYFAEYGLTPQACENWQGFLDAPSRFLLGVAPIAEGFLLADEGIAIVTETELYATTPAARAARGKRRETDVEGMLRDLSEVRIGDPVVHAAHGIGRYLGLVTLDSPEGPSEFLKLEYAEADVLYVPVASLSLISRYSGASMDAAPLHRLGSGQWEKAKRRAMQRARDTAAELLNLYARRAAREGHPFGFKAHDYEAFADGFGFDETPDQAAAIVAVVNDMRSGKPMDRLVCGDVGFGKTEVALRATFVAVADGKQVAVLVPTTLLAEQHFNTFTDRFAEWPVKIAELSRFRTGRETDRALAGLGEGSVDIAIGTHKLLEGSVRFRNLGLVIIDEEHRFGVRQKERLKALRAEVDVLTLTATPIPRSLAMALESLRDFSVIATAPEKRLAIKTFVARWSEGLIREAVLRELKRGGQVYFLYNEVETIAAMEERLTRLLPEARIRIAHGQMPERELESVMRDFYHQRFNLLLCTTIIETGIDVPTANTIVIARADRFGLAQLHQLRGRVGRSHHQAYAFLLTPDESTITANARKRLEAIQMMEELGSGFHLAMHDLEIRGAGEVLGEKQSGDMEEVGFSLYTEMLTSAVDALKSGREPDMEAPLAAATEIALRAPALLPETYCPDVHERLTLYKRLSNCRTDPALDQLTEELVDRFGLLPEPARTLVETHRLRIRLRPLGVARADAGPTATVIQFVPNPPVDAARIIAFVQSNSSARLAGPDRIRIERNAETVEARSKLLREFVAALEG
jgi:transcription-repair coupling factor (superfamily II helicase)